MHVFVTGGTGLVGTAVVAELLTHGHTVSGLARSERSAAALTAAGAQPVPGGLGDLEALRAGAEAADAVAHLAFDHAVADDADLQRSVAAESAAIATLGQALVGTGKAFAVVSGTPWIPGRASTEADPLPTVGPVAGRALAVEAALALADQGVRAASVRLPRTVHEDGEGGFAGILTSVARERGVAGYPGDGTQRWPAVHARDAASLFRLVLESAPAGTAWHAVADEGDPVRSIVEVIGRRLGLPVQPAPDEAFGPFAPVFTTDQPASSAHTRTTLGWVPTHPSLLADLELLTPEPVRG